MTNLPRGLDPFHHQHNITVYCKNGHDWEATMEKDFGEWFYVSGENCPICGEEIETKEDE